MEHTGTVRLVNDVLGDRIEHQLCASEHLERLVLGYRHPGQVDEASARFALDVWSENVPGTWLSLEVRGQFPPRCLGVSRYEVEDFVGLAPALDADVDVAPSFEGCGFGTIPSGQAVTGDDDLHIDIMLCTGREGLAW